MDGRRLDAFARALVDPSSRRRVLGRLAGGAFGGLLVQAKLEPTTAGCGRIRSRCERSSDCCAGARCRRGRCKCKPGWADCDDDRRCENLQNDADFCGSCAKSCEADEVCQDGGCVPCPEGRSLCEGTCCDAGEACLEEGRGNPKVCCPARRVYVECPEQHRCQRPGGTFCCVPAGETFPTICCPANDICGDVCCRGGDPETSLPCIDGICGSPSAPASYVRPK